MPDRVDADTQQEPAVQPDNGRDLPAEPDASAVERLEEEMESLRVQVAQVNDRYLRTMADYENYRRRMRQDKEDAVHYGIGSLMLDVLPVLDNLGRALQAAGDTQDLATLLQGVELTYSQFEQVLAQRGVVPVTAVGLPFDPNVHEAVMRVPTDQEPEGTVVAEIEKGYLMSGKVLRRILLRLAD